MAAFDSSFMFPVDNSKECKVLTLDEKENTSLYIPVFPPDMHFTSSSIEDNSVMPFLPKYAKYYIENCLRLGKVRRIDFSVREVPNYSTPQKCAFVHFDCLYDNENTRSMRDQLKEKGRFQSYGFDNGKEHCFLTLKHEAINRPRPHLLFKINHKPIRLPDEYDRNMEQVMAENLRLLEQLQEKEEEIRKLKLEIQEKDREKNRMVSSMSETTSQVDNLMSQVNQLTDCVNTFGMVAAAP